MGEFSLEASRLKDMHQQTTRRSHFDSIGHSSVNIFMKKKYTMSKWYWWKFFFLYSPGSMEYSLPLGILTYRRRRRTSHLNFQATERGL